MSSIACKKCQYTLWNKDSGLTKNTISKYLNDDQHVTICGKCNNKVIENYSDFEKKYGLNKPEDQIDMKIVRELIDKDLKIKRTEPEPEPEYVKEVKDTQVCKICEEPTRKITDYGLCKKCDDWLLHLVKSKSGRKDLTQVHNKILKGEMP